MNMASIAAILMIAVLIVLDILYLYKRKKAGYSSCSHNCSSCSSGCVMKDHLQKAAEENQKK